MIAPSQRFSSMGVRSNPTGFHQRQINSNASLNQRRITPGTLNGSSNFAPIPEQSRESGAASRTAIAAAVPGTITSSRGARPIGIAIGTVTSDHWWHGHRCRFVNGSWFIFDLGFFPWYGYPYDYYADDYYYGYPYGYDSGVYENEPADSNYDSITTARTPHMILQIRTGTPQ